MMCKKVESPKNGKNNEKRRKMEQTCENESIVSVKRYTQKTKGQEWSKPMLQRRPIRSKIHIRSKIVKVKLKE